MAGHAEAWWDDLRQEAEAPPPAPPPRRRGAVIAGAAAAVLASAGLAWWLSAPGEPRRQTPVLAERVPGKPTPARLASAAADEEQVRRAYEEFGLVYANSGAPGLQRFAESCVQSLKGDPRILDFCLAFDMFAETVAPSEPAGKPEARRIALAQAALPPGADPGRRIEEVRRLMRVASGLPSRPPPGEAAEDAPEEVSTARPAPAAPPRKAAAPPAKAQASRACRLQPTPADRLLCAYPGLKTQERRLKDAYERALASGADQLEIDRGQAEWRALRNAAGTRGELRALYDRRIRELNAAADAAKAGEPVS